MILDVAKMRAICGIPSTVGAKSDMLERCIEMVEDFELRQTLGNSFINVIEKDLSTYSLLLNGGRYTYDSIEYSFKGLNYAIAWLAFGRWTKTSNSNPTAFGTVIKSSQDSEPLQDRDLQIKAKEYTSAGQNYLQDVITFLQLNQENSLYFEYSRSNNVIGGAKKQSFSIDVIGG
jgi:hypothetical protein